MQHDHVLKMLNSYQLTPSQGWGRGCMRQNICYHVAAFLICFNLICNKTNSTNLYPLRKGYLRETCKSQNINPIYLTLSSPSVSFRSQQTPVKYVLVLSLIKKIYLHLHNFNILTFKNQAQRSRVCVNCM